MKTIISLLDFLALPTADFVTQCYWVLLGRNPSAEERRGGERALLSGCGRSQYLSEMHRSKEATNYRRRLNVESSDAEFVEILYNRHLGRSVEPEGLGYWLDLLRHQTRGVVEERIASSGEAIGAPVVWDKIEQFVAEYDYTRPWWRWGQRRHRERYIDIEVSRHAALRERQSFDQAMRAFDRASEEMAMALTRVASLSGVASRGIEHASTSTIPSMELCEDAQSGPTARGFLRRMRALSVDFACEDS